MRKTLYRAAARYLPIIAHAWAFAWAMENAPLLAPPFAIWLGNRLEQMAKDA